MNPLKVIAGPCSAETKEQVLQTAEGLYQIGVRTFRAGLWKPRSRPGSFEGVGAKGLAWFKELKLRFPDMQVCTEVACREHVELCLESGVDMLWIGARTSANPFLVDEIAAALSGVDIPVLVKNPISPDLALWIGAIERLQAAGLKQIAAVHRGVSSSEKIPYRNAPQWDMAVDFRTRCPNIPLYADPSHIAGDRAYLKDLSQRALDLGFDGLMIESHCCPSQALSDSSQQLTPAELGALLSGLTVRRAFSPDELFARDLQNLRAQIDVIDEDLIADLAARMHVSAKIGEFKKQKGVAIIQPDRWEQVLEKLASLAIKYQLDPAFVREVFSAIHSASIGEQE